MQTSYSGIKIAVLAASGFQENHLVGLQKALRGSGASLKIISPDNGVISGLSAQGWGHNHPVDAALNTALGVDFDAVVIAGGKASHAKLKTTAHTKRFIGSFQAAQKPVLALGDAQDLLVHTVQMDERVLCAEELSDSILSTMMEQIMSAATMDVAA